MATSAPRVTVDSCVFLNVLIGGEPKYPERLPAGRTLFRAGERGEVTIVASAMSIAEVAGAGPVRGSHIPDSERRLRIARAREWMHGMGFQVVEVDRHLATTAADLAIAHQLKGPDAIILASALRTGSQSLYSWDDDLLKLNGVVGDLRVIQPSAGSFDRDLFDIEEAAAAAST